MIIIEIFRVLFCWKNVLAVYFMLNICILLVFKQIYYEKQIAKLNKFTKLHISELFFNKSCLKTKQNIIMRPPPFIMWALFNLFESHIFFMKGHRFFMSINFVSQSLYYRSYRLFMISVTDSL